MPLTKYIKEFPILSEISQLKDQVELLETIGKGNYGFVYRGILKKQGLKCAVKVVFLKEDEIKEILLELAILKSCTHPNITGYYGSFTRKTDLLICMELCEAGGLDAMYKAYPKLLAEETISSILFEAIMVINSNKFIKALIYIHDVIGIIHRDIKAGNMFLTNNGELKLGDFGVSAKLDKVGGLASSFIGTPYWMAPEVISTDPDSPNFTGTSYSCKADIWSSFEILIDLRSIGITAIELADKKPPLSDIHPMRALLLIPTSDLQLSKPKDYTKSFNEFISFCLVKNALKRPSASQLLKHPFISKTATINRQRILLDFITKTKASVKIAKTNSDNDEFNPKISAKILYETMQLAKQAQQEPRELLKTYGDVYSSRNIFKDTLQNSEYPILEALAVSNPFTDPITCGDLLENRYILIAKSNGLFFIDLADQTQKFKSIPIIRNTPFKQIQIVEKYDVLVALSGKNSHIRQYKLSSIRSLIMYLTGTSMAQIQIYKLNTAGVNIQNNKTRNEAEQVSKWIHDYIKIPNTKDSHEFTIQETLSSIFMNVLFKQDIILFEWAREPYLKFMKLKRFWLPEGPRCINMIHDGHTVTQIYLGYEKEANMLNIEDSKVSEIPINQTFQSKASNQNKCRWRDFSQIPFRQNPNEGETVGNNTFSRRLANNTLGRKKMSDTDYYFLGTYHRHTRIVDIYGNIIVGDGLGKWDNGVLWTDPPNQIIQRKGKYILGIGARSIQVIDWNTATSLQYICVEEAVSLRCVSQKPGAILIYAKTKTETSMFLIREMLITGPGCYGPNKECIDVIVSHEAIVSQRSHTSGHDSTAGISSDEPQIRSNVPSRSSSARNSLITSSKATPTEIASSKLTMNNNYSSSNTSFGSFSIIQPVKQKSVVDDKLLSDISEGSANSSALIAKIGTTSFSRNLMGAPKLTITRASDSREPSSHSLVTDASNDLERACAQISKDPTPKSPLRKSIMTNESKSFDRINSKSLERDPVRELGVFPQRNIRIDLPESQDTYYGNTSTDVECKVEVEEEGKSLAKYMSRRRSSSVGNDD